jgi:hypothetical protein
MKETAPLRLYKYQPCNNYAFENLREKRLWFSKPENFNDPFDCDINFTIVDDTDENLQSLFVRMLALEPDKSTLSLKYTNRVKINEKFRSDAVKMARMATKSIVIGRQLGVSCFSEENDKHKIKKILINFPEAKLYEMQRSESEFKIFLQEIF